MQDDEFPDNERSDPQTEDSSKHNKHEEQITKSPGFFCWDKKTELQWLTDFISETSITGASVLCIQHPLQEDWKTLAERSSPIILCHSFTTNTEWTHLEGFLTYCGGLHGKRVIVIITDVKDSSSEKSVREEWGKWKFSGFDLIILTCQEIDFIRTYLSEDISPERRMARKTDILKNILRTASVKIGIFSRSDGSEYSWLMKMLTSNNFSGWVQSATSYYIANYKFEQFKVDVSHCTFGILYHTKNSGRINVTNVTSSLYDKELEYLHIKLGRDNVLVVIDDLEDSTDQMKDQILEEQHSIKEWARDLFLFCQEEKTDFTPYIKKMKQLEIMITGSTGQHIPASPGSSRQCAPASTGSTGQCIPASPGSSRQCAPASTGSTGQHIPASSGSSRQCAPASPGSSRQYAPASTGSTGQCIPAPQDSSRQRDSAPAGSTAHIPSFPNNSSTGQAQSRELGEWNGGEQNEGHNSSKEKSREGNRIKLPPYRVGTSPAVLNKNKCKVLWSCDCLLKEQIKRKQILTVGIFSITADTEYNWLKSLLGNTFGNARSFYISFTGFHQFMNDLSQCSHGILYHTKNRGRINVTDVTDSLYDKHLEYMSATLGKNRVFVVLDDLDDNSEKMKRAILQEQPKIYKLAGDLFLIKKGTDQQKMRCFEQYRKLYSV